MTGKTLIAIGTGRGSSEVGIGFDKFGKGSGVGIYDGYQGGPVSMDKGSTWEETFVSYVRTFGKTDEEKDRYEACARTLLASPEEKMIVERGGYPVSR